ncbi:aminotransferase class V-fold PLP-dependent enzyme [Actinomadura sp. 6N118]|uniref:aminotransferase class V-fold PLP-dependent enzyme n=1 Tax=Actinomadura sp. 6N118 TaxID=3375151 RepID=UPI0037A61C3B
MAGRGDRRGLAEHALVASPGLLERGGVQCARRPRHDGRRETSASRTCHGWLRGRCAGHSDGRAALAAYVGAAARFVGSGTAGMATVLGGWRLREGARVGVVRSEFGSNRLMMQRLATQRGWSLVELPVDDDSRILLDGLTAALSSGLDLVVFPHIASHRGVVQPAPAAGRLCRDAGVPLVLDVCQSLGHVEVAGVTADAYVGTSRKWLAGPRGSGFVIVPGLAEGAGPDAFPPTFQTHGWGERGGRPVRGDMPTPVLRVSPAAGAHQREVLALAKLLASTSLR